MKLSMTILTLFFLSLGGCGVDVTGEKFNNEKDQRIQSERKLYETESEAEVVEILFSSVTQSETMQWAYITNRLGNPFETYEKAEALCLSIDFDLPTVAMIEGEGKTIKRIESLASNTGELKKTVYIKGEPSETLRFLVCSRPVPVAN